MYSSMLLSVYKVSRFMHRVLIRLEAGLPFSSELMITDLADFELQTAEYNFLICVKF